MFMRKGLKMERVQNSVDDHGNRTAVVIPLEGNEAALEDFLEDLYGREKIRERRSQKTISKEDLLKGHRGGSSP